jgi:type II secretion system protein G
MKNNREKISKNTFLTLQQLFPKNFDMKKSNQGFTLIELLVVISIIGLLASVVIANLGEAKGKAQDARRISDMRQIQNALERYYNEHRQYPGPSVGVVIAGNQIGVGSPIDALLSPYLSSIPIDPTHDGIVYFYSYDPQHCSDSVRGACDCTGGARAVVAFNKAEASTNLQKDTCSGDDMNILNSDYNVILSQQGR